MNQQYSKAKEVELEISTTSTSGASQAITNSSYGEYGSSFHTVSI